MLRYSYISLIIASIMIQICAQQKWIPFLQQTNTKPSVTLSSSSNSNVSFSIQINGMSVGEQKAGEIAYQHLSIPGAELMRQEGLPQMPMVTKLIAIPDCDDVSLSVSRSNKIEFEKYYIHPSPGIEKRRSPDGSETTVEVFKENRLSYSSNADFPGKYAEILETGYVRGQKVARVAIYPLQFNPAGKKLTVFTDFDITLSFANPSSPVNKELGIFRNMMHHTAVNYEPSGLSASSKGNEISQKSTLSKSSSTSSITTGSVTRVTNLNTLVGTSAISVDYLIITHSSLFNSGSLTTLANHRRDLNGYDVVIVKVDDIYADSRFTSSTNYVDVRDFVRDVYLNGRANHTGDGHLGYILLVGDALQDDNSTTMVPASYFYHQYTYYDPHTGITYTLDHASDYYYACTGGDADNLMDLMYGRLSVGNETQLSNAVNKILSYESNSAGSWVDKTTLVSFSPDLWSYADPGIRTCTQIIPPAYQRSYAYRNYTTSGVTVVTEASPIFGQHFTSTQYDDSACVCGADLLDNWVYDDQTAGINNRIHKFIYNGHGGPFGFGAEGCGRKIFAYEGHSCTGSYFSNRLNNDLYSFMVFCACETGYFDHNSDDCISEALMNITGKGAIGILSSTRISYASAFGTVDGFVLQAMYGGLSQIMGECVMESKLNLSDLLFRRQYNLYGDPAVNLWPTGYIIAENITLSGTIDITNNITVSSGVTLTIASGTTLRFTDGVSIIVNGTLIANSTLTIPSGVSLIVGPSAVLKFASGASLNVNGIINAVGTSLSPVTITSISGTSQSSWSSLRLVGPTASNSHLSYCNITNGYAVIFENGAHATIDHCTISNNSYGILCYSSNPVITNNSIVNNTYVGIQNTLGASPRIEGNTISNNNTSVGVGIYAYGGGGYVTANTISGYNVGIYSRAYSTVSGYSNIDPHDPFSPYPNNNIQYNTYGIATYDHSTAVFGHHNYAFETEDGAYNWIENNSGSDILVGSNTTLYAENNWVGEDYEPSVIQGSGTTLSWYPPLYSNPWDEYHAAESIALSAYQSRSKAGALFSTQQTATGIEDTGDEVALLNEAISDHIRKSYAYAKEKYAQLLSSPKYSKTALVLLSHLYRESKDENVFTLFEEQKSNVKKEPVATINLSLTSNLLANMYAERKNYTAAISTFDEVIMRYPNTMEDRNARVRKIYYTLAGLHDKGSAEQQLKELLTLYKEEDDDIAMIKNFVEHASSEAFSKNKPKLHLDSPASVSTFSLLPNYPNPFNPVTKLSFSLQASGLATLKIYDVLGREVATLVNEYLEAGDNHHRTFDASRLPSGVYYYALKSGGKQEVKKMLYLK